MKIDLKKLLLLCLPALLLFTACGDDEPEPTAGTLHVNFRHLVGNKDLEFDGVRYASPAADTFTVSKFKYYISNVRLYSSATGTTYQEPNSYHLINPAEKATERKVGFTLSDIPFATYDVIEFYIGVDSLHNHSIDQTGDLSPNNDMAWNWNTGYKFVSLEGSYELQTNPKSTKGLVFHVGGDNNYKKLRFELTQPVMVGNSQNYTANFITDVNEMFQNPEMIDFDVLNETMGGPNAAIIAENYANGMIRYNGLSR